MEWQREPARFDFNGLFIFEVANNHQGDVAHGKRIIHEIADVAEAAKVRGAVKLQARDLETFIHPDFRTGTTNKHIPRFLSTRLSEEEYAALVEEIRKHGLLTMCTPFDEASVEMTDRLDFDVLKVGSCSANDWPLLERIAETGKPVVCSTAALPINDVDKVVSFFQHRGVAFALMHCVGLYPTPTDKLQLNRIEVFRMRYPGVPIGFSTHEDPENFQVIRAAYAKGARLFEKHVGIRTERHPLNAYSATPAQVRRWLEAYQETVLACGGEELEAPTLEEVASLEALMRGVYLRRPRQRGSPIAREDVFFAMPLFPGQMKSGEWREGLVADRDYGAEEPLPRSLRPPGRTKKEIVYHAIHAVKGMLNTARIAVGHEFAVELSHHYGLERFPSVGAVIIDCINREYCKKLIVQLPGQRHPRHYHHKKEETFQVLAGEVEVEVEWRSRRLYPGDTLVVPRGVWHSFWTATGVIFEEISTTHFADDSFYEDKTINRMPREQRKTRLNHWGRHQFDEFEEGPAAPEISGADDPDGRV